MHIQQATADNPTTTKGGTNHTKAPSPTTRATTPNTTQHSNEKKSCGYPDRSHRSILLSLSQIQVSFRELFVSFSFHSKRVLKKSFYSSSSTPFLVSNNPHILGYFCLRHIQQATADTPITFRGGPIHIKAPSSTTRATIPCTTQYSNEKTIVSIILPIVIPC